MTGIELARQAPVSLPRRVVDACRHSASEWRSRWQSQWPLPEADPVFVYSMRKVGSTSITASLRRAQVPCHKQHCLSGEARSRFERLRRDADLSAQHWLDDGHRCSQRLRRWRGRPATGRLRVFSFVKDPLAIALSDLFMHLFEFFPRQAEARQLRDDDRRHAFVLRVLSAGQGEADPDPFVRYLAAVCTWPASWFEHELEPVLGVSLNQVVRAPQGYWRLRGADSDTLILRADHIDACGAQAITELTGRPVAELARANVAARSVYGVLYRRTLQHFSLPRDLVDAYLGVSWLPLFYSDDERAAMRQRWTGR